MKKFLFFLFFFVPMLMMSQGTSTITLPFSFNDGFQELEKQSGVSFKLSDKDYKKEPKLKFDKNGSYLEILLPPLEKDIIVSFTTKFYGKQSSDSKLHLKAFVNNDSISRIAEMGRNSYAFSDKTIKLKFELKKPSTGNYGLGQIEIKYFEQNVDLSSAGYATLFIKYPFTMPTGLKGYFVEQQGDKLVLKEKYREGDNVREYTPLLLKGDAKIYTLPIYNGKVDAVSEVTLLKGKLEEGIVKAKKENEYLYCLANDPINGIGFYWKSEDGKTLTTAANKCYLPLLTSGSAVQGFSLDNLLTGIKELNTKESEQAKGTYDLSGRKVTQSAKGFYIVNGKKEIR